jgi:hypothetical protein
MRTELDSLVETLTTTLQRSVVMLALKDGPPHDATVLGSGMTSPREWWLAEATVALGILMLSAVHLEDLAKAVETANAGSDKSALPKIDGILIS